MRRVDALDVFRRELGGSRAAAGLALALITAVISGVAIFVNSYAVDEFDSPTVYTTVKNGFVGAAFLVFLLRPGPLAELRRVAPGKALGLLLLGVIGGSVPFVLFFEGLTRVDSGNAAFIHKTLFLWVAVLAVVFLRERLGRAQVGALALLFLAQWLLGGPGSLRGAGVTMVLGATLLWSIEVVLARRILATTSSGVAASGRMTLGAGLLFAWLAVTGRLDDVAHLTSDQWLWVAGTGAILLGYVGTWYAALKRAPATAVTCVLTIGAPVTAALNIVAGRPAPDGEQLAGYGVLLLACVVIAAFAVSRAEPRAGPAPAVAAEGAG
jgi:drug/metabolite transporter (DMT)-like permease